MENAKKKVGFVYFEEIHHIPHFIGIAAELSKNPEYQVDILTYKGKHGYLFKSISLLEAEKINVRQVVPPFIRQIIDKISGRKKPSAVYLYARHKKLLLSYDALVFTEKNHGYVHKYRKDGGKPYLISVNHGPPGRGYALQPSVKLFDLTLVCGETYANRLKKEGLLTPHHAIVGYSKFDVVTKEGQHTQPFKNQRPIVLYNPHFNKVNSSWYTHGLQVLDYFYKSDKYNLVFAPHIYLFNRKGFLKPSVIPKKYFEKENILIDLGSVKSSNMTYVLHSDIYLGDVSSQIYEFLLKPRPAIFINSKKVEWKNNSNYDFWINGDVVTSMEEMVMALKTLSTKKNNYLTVQKQFFKENMYSDPNYSASENAAMAISDFMAVQNKNNNQ